MRKVQISGSATKKFSTACKHPFRAGREHLSWTKMPSAAKSLLPKACHWRWRSLPLQACSCDANLARHLAHDCVIPDISDSLSQHMSLPKETIARFENQSPKNLGKV